MIRVREACPEDAPRLQRILEDAYAPFLNLLGPTPMPLTQDLAADIAAGDCLVVGDPPIGFAVFRVRGGTIHLENIATDPAAQGKGLGRALIEAVEARGRAAGCDTLQLATSPHLTGTRTFYGRLGYRETGEDDRRVFLEKPL